MEGLLERVKAATGPDRGIDFELFLEFEWTGQGDSRQAPAYTASVDAALALVERCLPGRLPMLWATSGGDGVWGAHFADLPTDTEYAPGPALALLAALLSALSAHPAQREAAPPPNRLARDE